MDDRLTNKCRAKVGMLVISECGRAASANCSLCGRPVCGRHKCTSSRGTVCPECSAAREVAQGTMQPRPPAGFTPPKTPIPPHGPQQPAGVMPAAGAALEQQVPPGGGQYSDPAWRARRRSIWYDDYPYYVTSPYFFSHGDYDTFDSGAGNIQQPQPGAPIMDPTES